MSSASKSSTVKFISKSGTYTSYIFCSKGDLYQEWSGEKNSSAVIWPSFKTDNPVLELVITSSRATETVTPQSVAWYINDVAVSTYGTDVFVASGSTLTIKDNIAYSPCVFAPAIIKAVAKILPSGASAPEKVTATYSIDIKEGSSDTYRVTIGTTATERPFTIWQKNQTITLLAQCELMGEDQKVSGTTYYVWHKAEGGAWVQKQAGTADTYVVNEADVETYADYYLEVYSDKDKTTLLGTDVQGVIDVQDPLDVDLNPDPIDETIEEGNSARSSVTYKPKVIVRGDSASAVASGFEGQWFKFLIRDHAGVVLNKYQDGNAAQSSDPMENSTTPIQCTDKGTGYVVTLAQCQQAGGDVSVVAEAVSDTDYAAGNY